MVAVSKPPISARCGRARSIMGFADGGLAPTAVGTVKGGGVATGPEGPAAGKRRPYAARLSPELRREQALDVALDLVTKGGAAAVSMEAVAAGMGVAKTVLYKVFPSADLLLVALVARAEKSAVRDVREFLPFDVAAARGSPVDATLAGTLLFLDAVRGDPDTWLLLFGVDWLPEAAQERRQKALNAVFDNLASLVAWATGERTSGALDVELSARALMSFLMTVVRLTVEEPEVYGAGRVDDFVRMILHSIITG